MPDGMTDGCVVRLRSGGPEMTIDRVENGIALCMWFHGAELMTAEIPLAGLVALIKARPLKMPDPSPHEQRLVAEEAELRDFLTKLRDFMRGDVFPTLHLLDRWLLEDQARAMGAYHAVLLRRFDRMRRVEAA